MTPAEAIKRNLHVGYGRSPLGGPAYRKPQEVLHDGSVVVRNSDCEPRRSERIWPPAKWRDEVKRGGLWRRVGLWSFVRASDMAGDAIAFASQCPHSAGQELYELQEKLRRLKWVARLLEGAAYQEAFYNGNSDYYETAEHKQTQKRVKRIRQWLLKGDSNA